MITQHCGMPLGRPINIEIVDSGIRNSGHVVWEQKFLFDVGKYWWRCKICNRKFCQRVRVKRESK